MVKINYTGVFYFSHYNMFALAGRVISIFSEYSSEPLTTDEYLVDLGQSYDNFDIVLKRDFKKPLTQEISDADGIRGNCTIAIGRHLKTCLVRPDEDMRNSARILLEIKNRYGTSIQSLGYGEESAAIQNMITDFEDNAEHIENTDLQILIDELKEAEQNFKDLMNERSTLIESPDFLTIKSTRDILYENLKDLFTLINILAKKSEDPWSSIILRINDYTESLRAAERSPQEQPEEEITE